MTEIEKSLRGFFKLHSFSTAGDEMWRVGFPIFVAAMNLPAERLGVLASLGSVATVLGFLAAGPLLSRYRSTDICLRADIIDAMSMVLFIAAAWIGKWLLPIMLFPVVIINSFNFGIWFVSSESLIGRTVPKESAQGVHRLSFLSYNIGGISGSSLAGIVFSFVGLSGIAFFNMCSFLGETLALKKLRTFEPQPMGPARSITNFLHIRASWATPFLLSMSTAASYTRFLVIGFLPFISFTLVRAGVPEWRAGIVLGAYALGSFLGSFFFDKTAARERLARMAFQDTAILCAMGSLIIAIGLFAPREVFFAPSLLIAGWSMARFTIEIRTMRHLAVHIDMLPDAIAAQGLLSRLAMPVAGLAFGLLISGSSHIVSVCVGALILTALAGVAVGFAMARTFLQEYRL